MVEKFGDFIIKSEEEELAEKEIDVKTFIEYLQWSELKKISLKDLQDNWSALLEIMND